jgi:hypothetical protein
VSLLARHLGEGGSPTIQVLIRIALRPARIVHFLNSFGILNPLVSAQWSLRPQRPEVFTAGAVVGGLWNSSERQRSMFL